MAARPMILVVESETRDAHSLAFSLADPRWDVATAVDSPSAIKTARELRPAVVVISGRVLGGGGVAALRRLRSSIHTAAIPVLGVCGLGLQQSLLDAGAQQCLPERTSPADLKAAVAHHLLDRPVVIEAASAVLRDPARLDALSRTRLLDSPVEKSYDRVTHLATQLLDVPVALVSLVDHDRQFFKSHHGLGEPWATQRQTPLSHSFCQWVVSSGESLAVASAQSDEVLRHNRAVDELHVTAYAGALLAAPEGAPIGSVCAIDSKPKTWTEDELATLNDLRDIVQSYVSAQSEPAARHALSAATRVLVRPNKSFNGSVRSQLVEVIDELSRRIGPAS